jgi:hypothetical protein
VAGSQAQIQCKAKQVMVLEQAWAKLRERLNPSRRQTVYIEGSSDSAGSDAGNRSHAGSLAHCLFVWGAVALGRATVSFAR